ncbi:hypothetical protein B0H16DRAFT_1729355 [Mycena metata]|uniref:Uncharacterized protein n=1 Tax=Mycena metata TaxID=1033252 RepID=A0AAD7IC60_9AGAR|nr:hypothetical protein B0H16DRAFT_1729355 [Mycena metata]
MRGNGLHLLDESRPFCGKSPQGMYTAAVASERVAVGKASVDWLLFLFPFLLAFSLYLAERRTAGPSTSTSSLTNANGAPNNQHLVQNAGAPPAEKKRKRTASDIDFAPPTANANTNANANGATTSIDGTGEDGSQVKRPRGRPRGSRNGRGGAAGG